MKIDISCANVEMTPAYAEYVEEKLGSCGDVVKRFEEGGELNLFFKIIRTTKHSHGDVFAAEAILRTVTHQAVVPGRHAQVHDGRMPFMRGFRMPAAAEFHRDPARLLRQRPPRDRPG